MASFIQIFYDPGAVFDRVRERGSWVAPLVATVLITMLIVFYISGTIGMENITRRALEQNPLVSGRIPPDQLEQVIQRSATPGRRALNMVAGGIGAAVVTLIIAVIFMVMLSIMDRKVELAKVLGTVAWASFPFVVIGSVMAVLILMVSRDPTELDPQTLLATNVGAFLDKNSTGRFVYSLAGSLDILVIGRLLLLAFGLSKVSTLAFARMLTLVISLWLVWVLLRGGFMAATGF